MRGWLRIHSANWLTGGVHLIIVAIAAQTGAAAAWPYALGAMSGVSFAAWVGNYRRLRRIDDTPLSNIATAAQGYAEVAGRAESPGGIPLASKLTNLPCVWFKYEVYEKSSDDQWSLQDSGVSDEPFVIKDASGQCVVDPEGAEVICSRKQKWTQGNYRYAEWVMLPRELVYALGDFVTVGGPNSALDQRADVSELIAGWKKKPADLLKRFDLNQDGTLDLMEWELARRQAHREVEAQHRDIRMRDGTHILRMPADGRLFLISNYLPGKLRLTYLLWAWAHIAIFFGAGAAAFALL